MRREGHGDAAAVYREEELTNKTKRLLVYLSLYSMLKKLKHISILVRGMVKTMK